MQSAIVKMCKSAVIMAMIMALMVAMAMAASQRGQQSRGQGPEGQIEGYDSEDASSMASKIMECRNILQQAGMIDLSTPGKAESENETEEPKMTEPGSPKSRRSFRRF